MNLLDDLAAHRVDRTPPWDGVARAMEAGRRRRLRRAAAAAGTALVIAGVATGIGIASTAGGGSFGIAPASSVPSLATVDGIGVTWLPAGYQPKIVAPGDRNYPNLGPVSSYQEFHDPKTPVPGNQGYPGPSVIGLALTVERNRPVDFAAAEKDPMSRVFAYKPSWTTVRGHRALLMAKPSDKALGPAAFRLLWQEGDDLVLEVDAFSGATLKQAQRLAASLVVADSPTTAPQTHAAVAGIRDAFKRAYTAPNSDSIALGAVEQGETIAPTLKKLRHLMPDAVNSSRVTTGDIRFLGPTEALVDANVSYAFLGTRAVNGFTQEAKLINGTWKVSRASFCRTITAPGAACPDSFLQE